MGELRSGWGAAGYRGLVDDLLVSAVRQTRALRRLSLSAGSSRAPLEGAGSSLALPGKAERASSAAPSRTIPAPPTPPSAPGAVKEEENASEESESEESESEEEECAKPKEPEKVVRSRAEPALPGIAAKSKADKERSRSGPKRTKSREKQEDAKSKRRHEGSRREAREESRERRHHRERERGGGRKEKKENKKTRRGGTRHQKLWRAQDSPFRRFHHRQPDDFWDRPPAL